MTEERTTPGTRAPSMSNPRVQRTRAHILAVARDLLAEVGPIGLTYTLLAERASVTRQTLYRHWPTRVALLIAVILDGHVDYPTPDPDLGSVARTWLHTIRSAMDDPAIRAAVLAVTAQADHDPDSVQALTAIATERLATFNGLLRPTGRQIDPDQYTLLYGPVMAKLFFDRAEVTDAFIDAVVTQWLATVSPAAG